jgi:DNA-binding transcriptional LysR family regulator
MMEPSQPHRFVRGIGIRQLRYAVLTADTQSFARAARTLNIKQATLSRSIASLEDRLGIPLFIRSTRGAVATENGKAFLSVARRIVTDIDNLVTTARAVSYGEEGRIAVGFSASLMAGNMRATIAEFMERHPDVQFDGIEAPPDKLRNDLETRIIDVAIAPSDFRRDELMRRSIWSERLLVALPHDHPLLAHERLHWTDLRDDFFVMPSQGVGPILSNLLSRRLADHGYRANVIMQDTSLESVISTVSIGRFVTLVTEASLGVTWPNLEFREIPDQGMTARLDFAVYWRSDNENPALKRFLKLLSERFPS